MFAERRTHLRITDESPSQRDQRPLSDGKVESLVVDDGVKGEPRLVELSSRSGEGIRVGLDEVGSLHRVPEPGIVVDGEGVEV